MNTTRHIKDTTLIAATAASTCLLAACSSGDKATITVQAEPPHARVYIIEDAAWQQSGGKSALRDPNDTTLEFINQHRIWGYASLEQPIKHDAPAGTYHIIVEGVHPNHTAGPTIFRHTGTATIPAEIPEGFELEPFFTYFGDNEGTNQ